MAPNSQIAQFTFPSAFPDLLFEQVEARIVAKMPSPSILQENFLGGQNGVRYRLRACMDYSEEFVQSIRQRRTTPAQDDRYQQERQLFGFFVSGIAALDCFNFFVYMSAAILSPNAFPIKTTGNTRNIKRKSTAALFSVQFPGTEISDALMKLSDDPKLGEWEDLRNVLAHRAAPGRVVYASIGTSKPDPDPDWKIDLTRSIKIDENLTPPRLNWLISTLANLVSAADQFSKKFF